MADRSERDPIPIHYTRTMAITLSTEVPGTEHLGPQHMAVTVAVPGDLLSPDHMPGQDHRRAVLELPVAQAASHLYAQWHRAVSQEPEPGDP